MSTKTALESALKEAMRANDDLRKRTIRMALSAIRQLEIDKGVTLDESAVLAILQKEIKSRQESIADARRAGRAEMEAAVHQEIAVLSAFLPQALTPEELEALVQEVIAEVGAKTPREMGQVMKVLTTRLQGRATGDQASQVVRRLLQG